MKNEKDGYTGVAYRRPIEGSNGNMIMTDLRFIGVKKEWYLELMKNGPPTDNIIERKILKENGPDEKYIYVRVKMGGFISDRDNIVRKSLKHFDDGSTLMTIESVYDQNVPEKNGVIRIDVFKTVKLRQDPEKPEDLLLTDYSTMDLKGYFPPRLMNMMMGTMLPKMEKQLRQKLYDVEKNGGVYNDTI